MIRSLLLIGFVSILYACGRSTAGENPSSIDSTTASNFTDTLGEEYETFYIVMADTGSDYYSLREKMFALSNQMHLPIDTMERGYNPLKKIIALPENHDDELYAGDYFPRRFPSESLSIEHLSSYTTHAGEHTMTVVTGIFDQEQSADSALAVLKKVDGDAFKVRSEIYIGCMH